jgi:hypothetical protein
MVTQGFPDHPHRGQATVTYITQGASKHEDSAGHAGIIREGGVQWMCAVSPLRSLRAKRTILIAFDPPSCHDRAAEVSIPNTTESRPSSPSVIFQSSMLKCLSKDLASLNLAASSFGSTCRSSTKW